MDLYQEGLEMFELQMLRYIHTHTLRRTLKKKMVMKLWVCECTVNQDLNGRVIRILFLKRVFILSFGREREKQMTRGHNIVADGWAGASNPHPHSKSPTHMHKKDLERSFPTDVHRRTDGPTDQRTDRRTKPFTELCVRN